MNIEAIQLPINVLIIDDNPADINSIKKTLKSKNKAATTFEVQDGIKAWDFLRKKEKFMEMPRPDIIFFGLDPSGNEGRDLLLNIQKYPELARIPLIVLSASRKRIDVLTAYDLNANCYVIKPKERVHLAHTIELIGDFWMTHVRYPRKKGL